MEINKYQLGKIYTIRHPNSEKYYIGSTCQEYLSRYFNSNKAQYKRKDLHTRKTLWILFDMGIDDCYIELLENYPCKDKNEYYEDNKEKVKEWRKKYYEDNKEKVKEQKKEYYQDNKEKIKEQKKEYYGDNKEKVKERKKEYYQENKEKIKEQKLRKKNL